jgi:hypothetical protein
MMPGPIPHARRPLMSRAVRAGIPIVDDAGVERTLATFRSDPAPDLAHPATQGSLARLRSAASERASGPVLRWLIALIVTSAVVMPAIILSAVFLVRTLRLPPWWIFVVLALAAGVAVGASLTILPRISARALAGRADLMADALLRMGRCAACGYPLAADAVPDDHIHRCSECGATWNDARLGKEVVPDGAPEYSTSFTSLLSMSAANRSQKRDDAGRRYAELPRVSHTRLPKLPGDQAVRRATMWPVMVFVIAIPLGVLTALSSLLIAKSTQSLALAIAVAAVALVMTPLLVFWSTRTQIRLTRRVLLKRRCCLACRQRLVRQGEMLHCDACDATWKRPARKVPR